MLFNADFTLAGAYFAAFLKPWSAFLASSLVGVELFPLSPMLATALQNLLFAAGTDATAEPARTASSEAASTAARRIRRRDMSEPFDERPSPDARVLLSRGDGPVAHLVPGGVDERDA